MLKLSANLHRQEPFRASGHGKGEQPQEQKKQRIRCLLAAIKESGRSRNLESGRRCHSAALEHGDDSNVYVASSLVDMYGKCGSMADARKIFDRMQRPDVVSLTSLVLGYAENGEAQEALRLFQLMKGGCEPNARTFVAGLKACSSLAAREEAKVRGSEIVKVVSLERGREIHSQASKFGFDTDVFVCNTLIDMYSKCGSMVDARNVFDTMQRDTISWNVLMLGYVGSKDGEAALRLLSAMKAENKHFPDNRTFVAAAKACTALAIKEDGRELNGRIVKVRSLESANAVHSQAKSAGYESNIFVANTLVDTYAKCGSMVDARRVFEAIAQQRDVISWTALILGYAENGQGSVALDLFEAMQAYGCAPNALTYVATLKACSSLASRETEPRAKMVLLEKTMAIHSRAARAKHDSDNFIANTLVDAYAKCGSLPDSQRVFDRISRRDVVSWTALILGHAESDHPQVALELFSGLEDCYVNSLTFVAALKACTNQAAREEGRGIGGKLVKMRSLETAFWIHQQAANKSCDLDVVLGNTLLDLYANCGSLPDARRLFDRLPARSVVSWNAMMLGYAENKEAESALELFSLMEKSCQPTSRTFVAALKACAVLAEAEEGRELEGKVAKMCALEKGIAVHLRASSYGFQWDLFVANSLVDMYAKCGSMVDSRRVFDGMRRHDVVSWNSLISGYADNDQGEAALELFVPMELEGCAHDSRTFLASLKACGCVGALDIGRTLHGKIRELGLDSDVVIATSLVDFYGKCGSMVDAEQVFSSIVTKDIVAWNALLTGYSRQGDTEALFQAFDRMMASRPRVRPDGVTFLCVLTACSHSGLVEQGKRYFEAMKSIHGLDPGMEHYHCLVDILGRSNRLEEAVAMVKEMPVVANIVSWTTVLSACQKWKNIEVAKVAFDALLELDEEQPAARVLMANIYGSVGMWDAKARVLQEA
ncbi:pentatricopeptide repeat-containing protein At2g13600 [Selaginella moellendorffii]|uniref:pentatricopeptide repeat-containing protein At2g13600 n=1 Tax=Selaginella moellendorffii TaxID=88036 RepID=UPI000D1CFBA7|nr:pentatricopeptide repeat-containing protein At2g13600 [Selaginella moellendorffii]|eukprot:XP_024525474.1 pentatricopeptide repeat-containing protein At2g13600 [Selaginella moellendorffii]